MKISSTGRGADLNQDAEAIALSKTETAAAEADDARASRLKHLHALAAAEPHLLEPTNILPLA
jgi:hypothetical protein